MYKCVECNNLFIEDDMCIGRHDYYFSSSCKYCSYDTYFTNTAISYILNMWKLRYGEYSDELLEIEIIRAKTRWLLRGGESKYVTFKPTEMITQVTNSTELRQALNENLHALLTKKRKLLLAKEVNNTLGKILIDVKMELMHKAITGDNKSISWFTDRQKEIAETCGVLPRLKEKVAV